MEPMKIVVRRGAGSNILIPRYVGYFLRARLWHWFTVVCLASSLSHSCVLMIHLIESKWSDFLFTHRNYLSIFIIIPLDEIALRRGPNRLVVTRLYHSSAMPTGVVNGSGSAWPALITIWALEYPSWILAAPNRPVLNIFFPFQIRDPSPLSVPTLATLIHVSNLSNSTSRSWSGDLSLPQE